ncbi:MAG TPA: GDSL-type esterase/lipase family protein [Terriglobales bacterium]|nr:GDSL-type esterase/lipase family protein [Terriglobales bacterium]
MSQNESPALLAVQQVPADAAELTRVLAPARKSAKWRSWTAKVLLLVFSLTFCLEFGTRIALSIGPVRRRMTGFDNSSYRLQWIGLHRIHREWTGEYAVYHPTRGWALKPDIKSMSVFDGKVLNSNSKGLRGKAEYAYQRTPGTRRIVVLGDSFTFGEEVSDDETYAHYLEAALPSTEVLNLGVQGYGHDQMLLYLKEEGVKYRPDIVIVGFASLDIYRNAWTFFAYAKPKFNLVSGQLELTNVPVPTPATVLAQEPYRSKAVDLLVMLREKVRGGLGENETEARKLTVAILDEIVATTRSIGAVPVIVDMPVYDEINNASVSMSGLEQYLHQYCQERGIACPFLRPRFREEVKKGANFNSRGHWSPEAHKLAAEEIEDFLVKDSSFLGVASARNVRSGSPMSLARQPQ